jgi:hypothetical protein
MYAIEFEADVRNNMIQIPSQYKELDSKHIKVFVVEVTSRKKMLPDGFLNPVSVASYKEIAQRDDLYDR